VGAQLQGEHAGTGLRVGIACARFNGGITTRLLDGALDALAESGMDRRDVVVAWAPGAFELPLVARAFARAGKVNAVLCFGAVIRGDTGHYDFVAGECAAGIQRVQLDTGLPVVFGVLTTDTLDQALDRSQPNHTNKGREAAETAIEMVRLLRAPQLSP
jgi:6,7-dimethyl-8-ribityllumazine synthase